MTKFISFGHRCSSASFLQLLNLKTESYPFDWMISKLDTIMLCIEDDFKEFCNIENYLYVPSETYNLIDGNRRHICYEDVSVNMLYETGPINNQTYGYQLAFNHQNIKSDLEYYKRCIIRLKELMKSDVKKIFIYFHPVLGIIDYNNNILTLLEEFNIFSSYMQTKTTNVFGLYFITVITKNNKKSDTFKFSNYDIYIIYCNENFLDGGAPCMGNYESEKNEIMDIIRTYI